mmetsp:Transcript_45055/g.111903  ORF Transcript_45055/g.111903 Transcript_45055/m.111903 type:complete len:236 (-) Transcript_45055:219-926(-)
MRPECKTHKPRLAETHPRWGRAEIPKVMHRLVFPKVPYAPLAVESRRGHVVLVYVHSGHRALVTQHLHHRLAHVRRPQGDGAIGVSEVQHGVHRVLPHDADRAQLQLVRRHHRARRDVPIRQLRELPDSAEQVVVREVLKTIRDLVVSEAVQFDAVLVVDVDVLLLRCSDHRVVLQHLHRTNRLTDVDIEEALHCVAVQQSDVSLLATKQEVSAVACEIHRVRPVRQPQVKQLLP